MLRRVIVAVSVLGMALIIVRAGAADELLDRARTVFRPLPLQAATAADNPSTPEKIALGRVLYFEPRLSASGLISCQTCHNVGLGGVDGQATSVGHAWQRGPRNAPTVFNAALNAVQFWDGRAPDLGEQAKGPMQASVEMASEPARVVGVLESMPAYVEMFRAAFPGVANAVTFDNVAHAIEAFEATLLTPNSPFDRYLRGDAAALTAEHADGLRLFMDRGCSACHGGVNVGGTSYFRFGVAKVPSATVRPPDDKGRAAVTRASADDYVFRVPTLRNVAVTRPYFHSGAVWTLDESVRIMSEVQLGVPLTDRDATHITAFLGTLTGDAPRVEHPILPVSTAATPKPVLGTPGK